MLKEKLGICLYEENYYTEEIQDNTEVPSIKEISKVSTKKSTKKLTIKLTKEADNELTNKSTNELTN